MGAFFVTLKDIVFRPKSFFEGVAIHHPLSGAFAFYFKLLLLDIIFAVGLSMIGLGQVFGVMASLLFKEPIALLAGFAGIAAAIFIFSAIMHVFVLIFRGKGGFSGTFTVFVCANAVHILFFLAVPILIFSMQRPAGPNIFLMICAGVYVLAVVAWMLIVQVIGYMKIHGMGVFRAVAALLIPTVLFALLTPRPDRTYRPRAGVLENIKAGAVVSGPIEWRYDLAAALREAASKRQALMVDFYTDWCTWCKKLDRETYENKDVAALAKRFVCVKVDGDKNAAAIRRYEVRAYPTIIFLNPDGIELKRVSGYVDPRGLTELMKQVIPQKTVVAPPPVSAPAAKEEMKPPSVTKEAGNIDEGSFKLKGITRTRSGYAAFINNSYVNAGEPIDDAKVVEITEKSVRIVDADGNEIVLDL